MIFYCIFFFLCLYINKQKQLNGQSGKFLIACLFAFLCFGYMTGSDWRYYELDYQDNSYARSVAYGEWAFAYFCKFFHHLISDFWLFNGLCKILFLSALIKFFGTFTSNNYLALALSFAGNLLFVVIDCPMRYMLALTCILIAIRLLLNNPTKRRKIFAYLFLAISLAFHTTSIIVLFILLTVPLSKVFCKIKPIYIVAIFSVFFFISSLSQVYDTILTRIVPLLSEDRFESYMDVNTENLISIGRIKSIIYLFMILYFKKDILDLKYGKEIYYFACVGTILGPLLSNIPTMFRILIINGFFEDIALATIVANRSMKSFSQLCGYMIIMASFVVLCKNCRDNELYTPYSNSIPYIIMQNHLPYDYRASYNSMNHDTYFWR